MQLRVLGAFAFVFAVLSGVSALTAPARAQTAAELQLMQACGGNLVACANLARQMQAMQGVAGNPGAAAVLNAAAAAATAANGAQVNPLAFGASSVVSPTNSVGAIAASQQYGQCVQNAGQNAQAAQACMRLLPPEWAGLAQQAQQAYLANPAAANAAATQALANAQALAAARQGQAALPQGNPFAAMAGQAAVNPAQGQNNAAAVQAAYVACMQAAGLNIALAQACAGPAQQAYGAMPGAANPLANNNNANAIVAAAGNYQNCVMSVGVTNAAGIQACQQRYLAGGQPNIPVPAGVGQSTIGNALLGAAAQAAAQAAAGGANPFGALLER